MSKSNLAQGYRGKELTIAEIEQIEE